MSPRARAELARERADDKYIEGTLDDAQYFAELCRIDAWLIAIEYRAPAQREEGDDNHA